MAKKRKSKASEGDGAAVPEIYHEPEDFEFDEVRGLTGARSVFWQNVIREMLVALPKMAQKKPDLCEGRIVLLTRGGEEIPVATAEPLFPCSMTDADDFELCMAVQCTVFNIQTPNGEVFTLPLEEIRGIYTVTDELYEQLKTAAAEAQESDGDGAESQEPFGFAAFTSLARQARKKSARRRRKAEESDTSD